MFRFTSKCSYTIDSYFLGNEVLLLFLLHFQKYCVFLECFIVINILQLKIVSLSSIPMLYEVHLVYFEKIPINDYFTNVILIYARKIDIALLKKHTILGEFHFIDLPFKTVIKDIKIQIHFIWFNIFPWQRDDGSAGLFTLNETFDF